MKKFYFIFIILSFFSISLFSYEWGGLVTESFKSSVDFPISVQQVNSTQSNSISLWVNVPFVNSGEWYLAAQGSYKYNYSFSGLNQDGKFSNILDLDLFKLNGVIKTEKLNVKFSLGRFFLVDNTAKIFAQNCDGLSINFSTSAVVFGFYAGYTGLLNGNNVITLNKDRSIEHNIGDFYSLSHPYIPLSTSLVFPSIGLNQSLSFQVNYFIDLLKDRYNRLYGILTLKGPIIGRFYYNFCTCFGTEDCSTLSNLSTLSIMAFYDIATIKLNCEYASGNHFIFSSFKGFNSSLSYNAAWNPEYSGVLLPGMEFSLANKDICFEVLEKLVVNCPKQNFVIRGLNSNIKIRLNLFSDLAFNMGIAYYCDFKENTQSNLSVSFALSLSF